MAVLITLVQFSSCKKENSVQNGRGSKDEFVERKLPDRSLYENHFKIIRPTDRNYSSRNKIYVLSATISEVIDYDNGRTLEEALKLAGGFGSDNAITIGIIRRRETGDSLILIPVHTTNLGKVTLVVGDIIYVENSGFRLPDRKQYDAVLKGFGNSIGGEPFVVVSGAVKKPQKLKFQKGMETGSAVRQASGFSKGIGPDILVFRRGKDFDLQISLNIDHDAWDKFPLQPNDILVVPRMTFE